MNSGWLWGKMRVNPEDIRQSRMFIYNNKDFFYTQICNGTRLIVTELRNHMTEAQAPTGSAIVNVVQIPIIYLRVLRD